MKLIKTFHKFKTQFLTKLPNIDVYLSVLTQLLMIAGIAAAIWYGGPLITYDNSIPLAQAEKRLYIIAYILLAWVLKLLMIDFDVSNFFHHHNPIIRKRIHALQCRFNGVIQFLKHTTTQKNNRTITLNQLPWYLLIGHQNAGKTTLLTHSNVHYILQKQTPNTSEDCDWWVTREVNLVDVPGKYLTTSASTKSEDDTTSINAILWKSLLRLIKKHRPKNSLNGIVIALPLPEMMKQGDPKKHQAQLRQLFQRIQEIQTFFPEPLPYYLVITKCDLLSGFSEFFAEATDDELTQAWGITLPPHRHGEKVQDLLAEQFNQLVKKLNQQLLWRLHQERNPLARPYIKDFPLQVERLKEFALDFINKFTALSSRPTLQGIYLTSALQQKPEPEETVIEAPNTTQRSVQLFKEPAPHSRAYFIKQIISHGLTAAKETPSGRSIPVKWKRRTAYAFSIGIISFAAFLFGKDFEQGVRQAYAIQNDLANYQLALQQIQDPDEHLEKTLSLLNSLEQIANQPSYKLDKLHLLTFYSNKSIQKSAAVYQQALQNILLPELKNYLAEHLSFPVNRNPESTYAALKAYLMLGERTHYSPDFISNTIQTLLPKTFSATTNKQLMHHINHALSAIQTPLALDANLIQSARSYLVALPSVQLGYVILQNIDANNLTSSINFSNKQNTISIPQMFTAKAFNNILSEQTTLAAQEALTGNWVLGTNTPPQPEQLAALVEQLRTTYINNYIAAWENLLANLQLTKPSNLAETDQIISNLISTHSPLLQMLQTLHDNTYFAPINNYSTKLQDLGLLIENKNTPDTGLHQIISGLQSLHQHLQTILTAQNQRKAAFTAVSNRMQHAGEPDAITTLRLIANQSPEPLKTWLDTISNDAWRYLMQESTHYLDTSWQEKVIQPYQTKIANHYPFSPNATQEVALNEFTEFFGNPGVVINFYNQYLQPFVDTSKTDWRWKTIDNQKIPFSDETLHQLHYALRIHHMFFPNGDDKLHVQFALQATNLDRAIKRIRLNINDKKIVDRGASSTYSSHLLAWPNKHDIKMTSIQFTLDNQKTVIRDYPGDWGWFKLVNQSLTNTLSHKEVVINLSEKNYPAEYTLFTQGALNPFLSSNLENFRLPAQLLMKERLHA